MAIRTPDEIYMKNNNRVTEVELIYHNKQKASERPEIHSSEQAYAVFLRSWHKGKIDLHEEFKILLLDNQRRCLGISKVACGGISECLIDIRLVFATALKAHASSIILAHNHPSGSLQASEQDKALTKRFKEAGKLLNIPVVDHIIVTKDGFWAFAEKEPWL